MINQINQTLAPILEDLRKVENLIQQQTILLQEKAKLDQAYEQVALSLEKAEAKLDRRKSKSHEEKLKVARHAYKPVAFERSEVSQRLLEIEQQLSLMGDPQALYQELLELKLRYIRQENHPFAAQLFEYEKELNELNGQVKEVQEAGRAVQKGIVMISRLVRESRNYGDYSDSLSAAYAYEQKLIYFLTLVPPVHRQMQEILAEWRDLDFPFPVGDIDRFAHFYQRIGRIVERERTYITGRNYVHGFCVYQQGLLRKLEARLKFSYDFLKGRIRGVEQIRERKLAQAR